MITCTTNISWVYFTCLYVALLGSFFKYFLSLNVCLVSCHMLIWFVCISWKYLARETKLEYIVGIENKSKLVTFPGLFFMRKVYDVRLQQNHQIRCRNGRTIFLNIKTSNIKIITDWWKIDKYCKHLVIQIHLLLKNSFIWINSTYFKIAFVYNFVMTCFLCH